MLKQIDENIGPPGRPRLVDQVSTNISAKTLVDTWSTDLWRQAPEKGSWARTLRSNGSNKCRPTLLRKPWSTLGRPTLVDQVDRCSRQVVEHPASPGTLVAFKTLPPQKRHVGSMINRGSTNPLRGSRSTTHGLMCSFSFCCVRAMEILSLCKSLSLNEEF